MISDITIAQKSNSLDDYYSEIYKLHSNAHKPEYMLVHKAITNLIENCNSYTEFGVNQGATLAAAILKQPSKVRAYDIKLDNYSHASHLFNSYTEENNIDYKIYEGDTLKIKIDPVDLLYIDTLHRYDHLIKELNLHGNKVKKYIVCHDTFAQKGLHQACEEWVQKNPEWKIKEYCKVNVGYTVLERN